MLEGVSTSPAPFSCSLPDPDLAERTRAWRSLADLVVSHERTVEGFRVVFERAARAQVETLVAGERSCCGWATWTVTSAGPAVVLEVAGPTGPVTALAAAFGL
jgi:hypothetical protein